MGIFRGGDIWEAVLEQEMRTFGGGDIWAVGLGLGSEDIRGDGI